MMTNSKKLTYLLVLIVVMLYVIIFNSEKIENSDIFMTLFSGPAILVISITIGVIILMIKMSEEQEKQDKENVFNKKIDNIIEKHKNILFRKYKQTHYIDEYGKEVDNGWDREIKYFIEHVVKDDIWLLNENDEWKVKHKINSCMIDMKYNTNYEPEYEETEIKTGIDYENYIEKILLKDNFVVNRTPTTGDQGVDLIASKNKKRIAIQCKYYSKPVGNKAVQEVIAGKDYYECEYACVASNNSYTPAAKKLAFTSDVMLLNEDNIVEELNKIIGNTDFSSCDDTDEDESKGFKAEELFFTDLTPPDDPLKIK